MQGNNFTRTLRLFGHLVVRPWNIPDYFLHGPLCRKSPLELGLPWFSLSAIRFLNRYLKNSMDVFEYGSGGSTIYFARRARSVVSTEDNSEWLARVRAAVSQGLFDRVTLQHRPFDFHSAIGFAESDYLHSIPDRKFDVIVVDGTEELIPVRPTCFEIAEAKVKEGGIIIVDDAWRYPQLHRHNRARSWREFRSIGPCRPGVTSTDIYFY